jgi:hypothetical protein
MQEFMKRLLGFIILLSILSLSTTAQARSEEVPGSASVILDIMLIRPIGLVATVVGAGVFVALSPLTALASIPAPHDAFIKTGQILVLAPGAYTFVRPLGVPVMQVQRK